MKILLLMIACIVSITVMGQASKPEFKGRQDVSIIDTGQKLVYDDSTKSVGLMPKGWNPTPVLHVVGKLTDTLQIKRDTTELEKHYLREYWVGYIYSAVDSIQYWIRPQTSASQALGFGTITPTHTIHIIGNNKSGKGLGLDIRNDSLIVTGDLDMNEAARIFLDYCRQYIHCKIDSLNVELENCKRK